MHAFDWQTWLALAAVAAAAFVLARRAYRLVRGRAKSGCQTGGCGSCAVQADATGLKQRPLVELDFPRVSATEQKEPR